MPALHGSEGREGGRTGEGEDAGGGGEGGAGEREGAAGEEGIGGGRNMTELGMQIREARSKFIKRTGSEPRTVYLGEQEMEMVPAWMKEVGSEIVPSESCPEFTKRCKVGGLFVFGVNDPTHIGMA